MSKIGLKLIALFMSGLIITVAAVSVIGLTIMSNSITSIAVDGNQTSVATVESKLGEVLQRFRRVVLTMDAMDFTSPGNEDICDEYWSLTHSYESEFGAFFDTDGVAYWQTDNFDLAPVDVNKALAGGWMGFVRDSKADLTVQYCVPLQDDNVTFGFAILGLYLSGDDFVDSMQTLTGANITFFSDNIRLSTSIINANGTREVGTTMTQSTADIVLGQGQNYEGTAIVLGANHYTSYTPIFDIDGTIIGAYSAITPTAPTDAVMNRLILILVCVSVGMAVLSIVAIIIVNNNILVKPIKEANKIADDMANGQFRMPSSEYKFGKDELGEFVRRLMHSKTELCGYIDDMSRVLAEMATGNFTAQTKVAYNGDFTEIRESFSKIEEALRDIIGNIDQSSWDVSNGSEQIAEGSQMLADGTTQQAAAIQELSASIEDIAIRVQDSADNASEASKISTQTADKIAFQNNEINNMLGAMDDIKKKSDQIRTIINAIDDIAFQTNILALNAAVEAARAGEAGKGFAVVADEVRNLAAKSAESAKRTGELINATIEAVDKGTIIAEGTANTMKQVTELAVKSNKYISDITTASEEQAVSISQIKIGIDSISSVVQQNSATAEETAAACHELSNQSAALKTQIGRFTV